MNHIYNCGNLIYSNENPDIFFEYCFPYLKKNTKGYTIETSAFGNIGVYNVMKNEYGYLLQNKTNTIKLYEHYPNLYKYIDVHPTLVIEQPIEEAIKKPYDMYKYLAFDEKENYDDNYRIFSEDFRTYCKLKEDNVTNHPLFDIKYLCMEMLEFKGLLDRQHYQTYIDILNSYKDAVDNYNKGLTIRVINDNFEKDTNNC